MTICAFCKREDLPSAAAFPPIARMPCAHAKPDGEPCHEGSPHGTYDEEILALVVEDDAMWDPEFHPPAVSEAPGTPAGGPVTSPAGGQPVPYAGPPKVGAAIVTTNEKGDFIVGGLIGAPQYDLAERRAIVELGLDPSNPQAARAAIIEPALAGREPKKPDRRADTRRRDDKRKKALAARKDDDGEESDIDDWDPDA